MDIMNGSYAQTHFPCKLWDAGEKGLTLSAFEWEKDRKTLIYGQVDYMYMQGKKVLPVDADPQEDSIPGYLVWMKSRRYSVN